MMGESYFARPQGHDGGPSFMDGLAKLYLSVAVVWTALLGGGIAYLFVHRRQPCVRVRNLPLAVSSVACLHVYWVLCMFAYSMNGTYPCNVEYWIMSIYLPLGIALFQANNMQLLSVACLQEQLLSGSDGSAPKVKPPARTLRRYWLQFNGMSLLRRTEFAIGVGMIAQLIISLAIFLASRKFNSFGTLGEPVSAEACRRGPEWIPSILWQLVWAWFFAPFILWKIRHINDVHQWRRQTTICIIAGLLGSPLWLAALYSSSPTWDLINKYWVPPLWFTPGIVAMQGATILGPVVKLRQTLKSQKYVAQALREWEDRKRKGDKASLSGSTAAASSQAPTVSTGATGRSGIHSKDALEKYLAGDVHGLLEFAVHREFSGENITFLVFVRQWRAAWAAVADEHPDYDWETDAAGHRRHLFKVAVEIFADLVEVATARFPINIEAPVLVGLRRTFGEAARILDRPLSTTVATPFSFPDETRAPGATGGDSTIELIQRDLQRDLKGLAGATVAAVDGPGTPQSGAPHTWPQEMYLSSQHNVMRRPTRLPDTVRVPRDFDGQVFDRAHDSVMHMVLHNTWPRFVDDCAKQNAAEAGLADVERGGLTGRFRRKGRRASTFF